MRLSAFRICNFRSIVDSGWNKVSPDNITVLIGQNESGKTSVLEALNAFYTGIITEEILRSDLSIPCIYCEFQAETGEISEILESLNLSETIGNTLLENKCVVLKRSWDSQRNSLVEIGNEEILTVYTQEKDALERSEKNLLTAIFGITEKGAALEKDIARLKQEEASSIREYQQLHNSLSEYQRLIQKAKTPELKNQAQTEHDKLLITLEHLKMQTENKQSRLLELQKEITEINEKYNHSKQTVESIQKLEEAGYKLESLQESLTHANKALEASISSRETRNLEQKIYNYNQQYQSESLHLENLKKESLLNKTIASYLFKGLNTEDARQESVKLLSRSRTFSSLTEIGNAFFACVPMFEFFEDFSSLLPNRIDLDDLVNENTSVEGYKAAMNFLIISGIDAEFFAQQNNRILKQKIENLNGEITVNFQDFWRQSIGRNNKIKINFELEHYDTSHPDKKGKPYLEFWVKDSRERLYPKQRSRGVRWFLSFYLELKATAKSQQREKILLIDEPGISLHARAQEDVLKVFEDIKENLTIMYTTHSPHLVDVNKLYRILAVQRALEEDENSETMVYDATSLSKASSDTLSPIYTLMGARFTDQQFIQKRNNVLVEDYASFYFLSALYKMLKPETEMFFIPATSVNNIPTIANLLMGWKLEYLIVLSDTPEANQVKKELEVNLFGNNPEGIEKRIISLYQQKKVVDLFSTIDFKNHILQKRIGITETNSEYLEINNLSAPVLSMEFMNLASAGKISMTDFDDETNENIRDLFRRLEERLK